MRNPEDELSSRLKQLPTRISPTLDLMPGIEARLRDPEMSWSSRLWAARIHLIAAAVIFAAGLVVGRMSESRSAARVVSAERSTIDGDFAAAAEVQRTGTAYVAAVARMAHGTANPSMRGQAHESAMAALASAARELAAMANDVPRSTRF